MFVINSTHSLKWPTVKGFKLAKGDNKFKDASAVPESVRGKLLRFSAVPAGSERGILEFRGDVPDWAKGAVKAAEEASGDDAPSGNAGGSKLEGFDPTTVDLTEKALGKLNVEQLKLVAAELEVDVSSAKNKAEIVAAILKEANGDDSPSV